MHYVSDKSLRRPDYRYNQHGVGYPIKARPSIVWDHIDGPLLYFRDGQLHWLTWWERLRCWLGYDDAMSLEFKYRPDLQGLCELCSEPGMVWVGSQILCWEHYCAATKAAQAIEQKSDEETERKWGGA